MSKIEIGNSHNAECMFGLLCHKGTEWRGDILGQIAHFLGQITHLAIRKQQKTSSFWTNRAQKKRKTLIKKILRVQVLKSSFRMSFRAWRSILLQGKRDRPIRYRIEMRNARTKEGGRNKKRKTKEMSCACQKNIYLCTVLIRATMNDVTVRRWRDSSAG